MSEYLVLYNSLLEKRQLIAEDGLSGVEIKRKKLEKVVDKNVRTC